MFHSFIVKNLFLLQKFISFPSRGYAIEKIPVSVIVEFVLLVDVVFVALLPAVELQSASIRLLSQR